MICSDRTKQARRRRTKPDHQHDAVGSALKVRPARHAFAGGSCQFHQCSAQRTEQTRLVRDAPAAEKSSRCIGTPYRRQSKLDLKYPYRNDEIDAANNRFGLHQICRTPQVPGNIRRRQLEIMWIAHNDILKSK